MIWLGIVYNAISNIAYNMDKFIVFHEVVDFNLTPVDWLINFNIVFA